jgi:beta-lactamase regulating signal transducer with metallopeptidase domain
MNAPTDWLITTAGQGAAGLLAWSWQAMVLLACVWLGLKICRAKAPALRHQVWLFGLIVVATLPLQSIVVRSLPSPRARGPVLTYVVEAPQIVIDLAPRPPAQTLPEAAPNKTATASAVKATAKTPTVPHSLFAGLFAAWVIGALIMMARLTKTHFDMRRALRSAQSMHPSDLDCGESACSTRGRVGLRLSAEISSPVLCGVFRPTILLPADVGDWTTPLERAAMIRHELAHVERRDPLINLFQAALSVIFFFHPLVRYACRQLSLEREMACDDRVVASGVAAEDYAAGILKAAERGVARGAPRGAHQLAIFGARQILERRLEMILNTDRSRTLAHQWRYLVLPIALIAVAGFLLIPRHSAKNSSSNSPAKDSPVKVTYSAQEQELIEMIRQAAESTPQRWPHLKAGLPDERLLFIDFRIYDKRSSLTIITPRPVRFFGGPRLTKVEVGDFEVSVNGDSAVVDFIGAIHFISPGQDKEEVVTDPYRVELENVRGQWQVDRRKRGLGLVGIPMRPPSPETLGAGVFNVPFGPTVTTGMIVVNNGDAEFSVQSSLSFDSPQSGEALLGKQAVHAIKDGMMRLGELEIRGGKGTRLSLVEKGVQTPGQVEAIKSGMDDISFEDRFELKWGERIYYGFGPVIASYYLPDKRLQIMESPETRFYRTPDRTGEAMTLQQVAQELRDQAMRKN